MITQKPKGWKADVEEYLLTHPEVEDYSLSLLSEIIGERYGIDEDDDELWDWIEELVR